MGKHRSYDHSKIVFVLLLLSSEVAELITVVPVYMYVCLCLSICLCVCECVSVCLLATDLLGNHVA